MRFVLIPKRALSVYLIFIKKAMVLVPVLALLICLESVLLAHQLSFGMEINANHAIL